MEKALSVIIPCYNAEGYIKRCLDTIVNQTIGIQNLEIIVIDDASTDKSLQYIKRYEEQYPENILIIALEQNAGQANARNIGMKYVTSKYFTFVDADDWLELHAYERMLKPTEYNCDLIQCGVVEAIEGAPLHYCPLKNQQKLFCVNNETERKEFFSQCRLTGMIGVSLYRTEWIRTEKFEFMLFPKYEDNYWAGLITYSFHSYYAIPDCLYFYRLLDDSNSHKRNDEGHFVRLEVELEKLRYYMQKGIFQIYYKEVQESFLELFYMNTLHIMCFEFDYIPLKIIEMMQKTVRKIYPDYLNYCRDRANFLSPILTIAFDFPIEIWKQYKIAYIEWVTKGNSQQIIKIFTQLKNYLEIED